MSAFKIGRPMTSTDVVAGAKVDVRAGAGYKGNFLWSRFAGKSEDLLNAHHH